MTIAFSPVLLFAASILVALMGLAIQQGNTCMVAAVDEVVMQGRTRRFQAIGEAGVWAAGILAIATTVGLFVPAQLLHGAGWLTIFGGVMLGVGAFVNGACVFGSVARLGSGQLAFLATPVGLFSASLALVEVERAAPGFGSLIASLRPAIPLSSAMVPIIVPLVLLAALAGWRGQALLFQPGNRSFRYRLQRALRSPHGATSMIGIYFALLLLFAGPWAYPEVLADIARGVSAADVWQRAALFLALLVGAIAGGLRIGKRFSLPRPIHAIRCLAGGFIMGAGAVMVPGSNDWLLLLGLPMLWPFALLALFAMVVTIAALRLATRR